MIAMISWFKKLFKIGPKASRGGFKVLWETSYVKVKYPKSPNI